MNKKEISSTIPYDRRSLAGQGKSLSLESALDEKAIRLNLLNNDVRFGENSPRYDFMTYVTRLTSARPDVAAAELGAMRAMVETGLMRMRDAAFQAQVSAALASISNRFDIQQQVVTTASNPQITAAIEGLMRQQPMLRTVMFQGIGEGKSSQKGSTSNRLFILPHLEKAVGRTGAVLLLILILAALLPASVHAQETEPTPAETPTPAAVAMASDREIKGGGDEVLPIGTVRGNSDINIRQGDGTGFSVITQVQPGDQVTVLGENKNGTWTAISTVEYQGWIRSDFLVVQPGFSLPVLDASLPLNVPTVDESPSGVEPAADEKTSNVKETELPANQVGELLLSAQQELSDKITQVKLIDEIPTAFYQGKYQVGKYNEKTQTWEQIYPDKSVSEMTALDIVTAGSKLTNTYETVITSKRWAPLGPQEVIDFGVQGASAFGIVDVLQDQGDNGFLEMRVGGIIVDVAEKNIPIFDTKGNSSALEFSTQVLTVAVTDRNGKVLFLPIAAGINPHLVDTTSGKVYRSRINGEFHDEVYISSTKLETNDGGSALNPNMLNTKPVSNIQVGKFGIVVIMDSVPLPNNEVIREAHSLYAQAEIDALLNGTQQIDEASLQVNHLLAMLTWGEAYGATLQDYVVPSQPLLSELITGDFSGLMNQGGQLSVTGSASHVAALR